MRDPDFIPTPSELAEAELLPKVEPTEAERAMYRELFGLTDESQREDPEWPF
jgi:hypothetical protein